MSSVGFCDVILTHYIIEYKIKLFLSLPSFLLKSFHKIRKNVLVLVCTMFRWKCNNNNILMCQTINSKWIGRIVQMGVGDLFISQFPHQLKGDQISPFTFVSLNQFCTFILKSML